ncbi:MULTISPECIES: sugar transferase [Corynebacterium]|uniref:Sugar transferase n=1 Tax=Corynebacterium amycolatum TaxID=43765 RepID=A0AB38XWK7_CORAY|nr:MULTISPECIES: sugar transferase [Corynebacterium]AIN82133.1 bacterial sugar transferase family protein [Corynebacterium sp. ATCC 6931]MBC6725968.1 sugar transferase [Corynebacterium amycolatum]WET44313.1 sugar transferase [Corynebacterium amycolatum]
MDSLSIRAQRVIKRGIDVAASAAGLIVLSPVMGATALAVRLSMGKPVLFRQERPGQDGEPFNILKFRTMHHVNPAKGFVDDASRLTQVGKFLRSTSLDELPELFNVLRGDMSLVGPRPLRMKYLERYSPRQARRHEVPPGITGLAQVSGRNGITWEERFEYDVQYVDNWSLLLDAKILLDTILVVLRREGISEEGQATMTEFTGSSNNGSSDKDVSANEDS